MIQHSYRFSGAHGDGRLERGRVSASTRSAAMRMLTDRGIHPIEVVAEKSIATRRVTLPVADLAIALGVLADMLDAGLPLTRALAMLVTVAPPRVAVALPPVLSFVREGQSFAASLVQADVRLPSEIEGIIRAGERGSGLAAAIREAALLCEDGAASRAALRSALAYPTLLALAGTASLGLLIGIVLPRFATILGDLGQTLPATTRLVLRAGQVVRASAVPSVIVVSLSALLWRTWVSSVEGRRAWHALLLRVPFAGDVRLGAASARLCTALAALLNSGIPLAVALRSAATATGDDEMAARVMLARTDVEQGCRFSDALARRDVTSAFVQRLVRAGEESGRLAAMLTHAGRLERERVLRRLNAAVRLLEPAMIVAFGGIVALVAAALLQALYSVRPAA